MNNRKLKEMNKKVIFKSSNINKEKIRFFSFFNLIDRIIKTKNIRLK